MIYERLETIGNQSYQVDLMHTAMEHQIEENLEDTKPPSKENKSLRKPAKPEQIPKKIAYEKDVEFAQIKANDLQNDVA